MTEVDESTREGVSFAAGALGPLFLQDPEHDRDALAPVLRAFSEMDPEAAAREWPLAGPGRLEAAAAAIGSMREGARLACGGDPDPLTWEYRRLFVGPGRKPAPPWGSVYTDRECVVFGAATLELRRWMRGQGIERLGDPTDPEDHIGYLLLLAAWIAEHRPELLREFLELHVLTWSTHFLDQLEEAAEHPFYRGAAALARITLEGAGEALGARPVIPRYYR